MRRGTPGAISLGRSLRILRTNAKLPMREVGLRIGAPAATVHQVENGQRALKEPKIPIWANALGVSEDRLRELWMRAELMPEPPLIRRRAKSITSGELECAVAELTGSERDRVLGYITALIENRGQS